MHVLEIKLRLKHRHVRLLVQKTGEEHGHDLDGEAFERVARAASGLLGELKIRLPAGAELRAVSIEPARRVLRGSYASRGTTTALLLDGRAFDALPAPAISAFVAAACHEAGYAAEDQPTVSEPVYWESLYQEGEDGWELGHPTPPLLRAFEQLEPGRAVVVGCGRGHEARALAKLGFDVLGVDFAHDAIAAARELTGKEGSPARFEQRDLFTLPGDHAPFRYWIEHTCFCAIDPARRAAYVEAAARSLVAGGELAGIFYAHGRPGGPPFTTSREEVERLFGRQFEILALEVAPDSIERRKGDELLARMKRR